MSYEIGDRFGRWRIVRALQPMRRGGQRRARVLVQCVCGYQGEVYWDLLKDGRTTGCRKVQCRMRWMAAQELAPRLQAMLPGRIAELIPDANAATLEALVSTAMDDVVSQYIREMERLRHGYR